MRTLFGLAVVTASTLLLAASGAQAGVTYVNNGQTTCREFTSTITVGNRLQQGVGMACLQGDGSWQIVSGPGTGNSFYDNGIPTAYPPASYPVNNVYYNEPAQVQYVIQRERVYVPSASTVIISNGYDRGYGWNRPYHNGYPLQYRYRTDRHHHHHDHDDRGPRGRR